LAGEGRSSVEEKVSSDLENKIAKAVEQEGGRRTMGAEERRRERGTHSAACFRSPAKVTVRDFAPPAREALEGQ
jgi:hypothetical protein